MSKHERAFRDFFDYADDEEINEDDLITWDGNTDRTPDAEDGHWINEEYD